MNARLAALAVAVLSLGLAACETKEGQMAMENVSVTDKGVAVTKPAAPDVQKAALEQITPSAGYKTDKCIVSDEPLGAGKVAYSYGGQEVQFCCAGCAAKFMQSPDTYLSKLAK